MKTKIKETRLEPKEFGERKVSQMNFSYIITLPKKFVQNTQNGQIVRIVKLTMLEDGSLKITPVGMKNEPSEFTVM